ncbi:MAG: LysM peptidoglycan-binding domain-containing protein [Kiritimatiellae bacterium]|nr:LysM peptidoglycan-binding domain-containing protein [Kiritimatiellia bacterium]
MKKINFANIPAIAMVALLSGCSTMYSGFGTYEQERQERQYQRDQTRLREQMAQRQLQQNADSALSAARDAESRIRHLEQRLERLEATSRNVSSYASLADIDALRRENESLRAQLAETRASQENMRAEIISNVQSLLKDQQNRAATAAPKAVAQALSGYEHKVESGQTLSAIAKAYGVSVKKIKDANNLTSDAIRVGQVLFIPD